MKKIIVVAILLLFSFQILCSQPIQSKGLRFLDGQSSYQFIGANYWYGGFLYATDSSRLKNELAFFQRNGVTNLRVMLGSEGGNSYLFRISTPLQKQPFQLNENVLKGYDYLLYQAKNYNIKIVFVLNNNWEWSGGFGQYLEWAGKGNCPLPKTKNWSWDAYCDYISKYYTCTECDIIFREFISNVINRKNTFTNILYNNDDAIMAWELANEPRPMKPEAIDNFVNWVSNTSSYIKSIDKSHLVTIGTEGMIGTNKDYNLFKRIHQLSTIDYATIHIWPKTWQWYNGEIDQSTTDTTLVKTINYIYQHLQVCNKLNKPLVIEEFGLNRDENSFSAKATTIHRDIYFEEIFKLIAKENIAGCNFWGSFGVPSNTTKNKYWNATMPYSADPPQEEQGLYSVFKNDKSTWLLVKKYNQLLKK